MKRNQHVFSVAEMGWYMLICHMTLHRAAPALPRLLEYWNLISLCYCSSVWQCI